VDVEMAKRRAMMDRGKATSAALALPLLLPEHPSSIFSVNTIALVDL